LIDGVNTKYLKVIPDERGWLMEILRCDDDVFEKFGQVYFTAAYPGVVKGWHLHKIQKDNLVCVNGMIKVAIYDGRNISSTYGELNEFFIGEKNPMMINIPTHVYHGFQALGDETAMCINISTHPYNYDKPDEYRLEPDTDKIPYNWNKSAKIL
jgi:dTDP-4-dehydrorhamnose 3,5-epimerase